MTSATFLMILALNNLSCAGGAAGEPAAATTVDAATKERVVAQGGLVNYPEHVLGENILVNPGFESLDPSGAKPTAWTLSNAFSGNGSEFFEGTRSVAMSNAPAFPYTESASQYNALKAGSYMIGGRIKTRGLGDNTAGMKGVRLRISGDNTVETTDIVSGSSDWKYFQRSLVHFERDVNALFRLESYNEPSGDAWFDSLELRKLQYPVETYLLYPNYRGILFDDQSTTIRCDVTVDVPAGTSPADFEVKLSLVEAGTGNEIAGKTVAAQEHFVESVDGAAMRYDVAYYLRTYLVRKASQTTYYEYAPYQVVKRAAASRSGMVMSFDQNNRILVRGTPTFVLGVYDSKMNYYDSEATWATELTNRRRLFELPINMYLNYWFGTASSSSINKLMNVLQNHNILWLQTGNCFGKGYDPSQFAIDNPTSGFLDSIANHRGLAGFYTIDECVSELAPTMFQQYSRLRAHKTDGVTFAALLSSPSLKVWRDSVDLLSTDPYPMWHTEPAAGYPLHLVADWTAAARKAVRNSRPTMTVIQYFKGGSTGRFPTRAELRNMSYMAIVEGSNGLMYWSLGTGGGLADVCADWCAEKNLHFDDLKAVLTELKGLEGALADVDRPEYLLRVDNPAVRTRVKFSDGKGYLFAYNYGNQAVSAGFTWSGTISAIEVNGESRTIAPSGSAFTDSFGPYQAHVYRISP